MTTINVKNIGFSRPRPTTKGYNVLVNYSNKKTVTIDTGEVMCPYGVDKSSSDVSMKLNVNDTLRSILESIDELNVTLPERLGWFEDDVEPFYFTPFQQNNTLRVKIPLTRSGALDVEVLTADDDTLSTIGDIVPGSKLRCTLEWKNVWIIDETYGYFWTVKQIEILN